MNIENLADRPDERLRRIIIQNLGPTGEVESEQSIIGNGVAVMCFKSYSQDDEAYRVGHTFLDNCCCDDIAYLLLEHPELKPVCGRIYLELHKSLVLANASDTKH